MLDKQHPYAVGETRAVVGACVLWPGKPNKHGHGTADVGDLYADGKRHRTTAHYAVWWRHYGEKPADGMVLHHICENPLCVNVEHLELISAEQHNTLHSTTTHCKRGHARTTENTWTDKQGRRQCRDCWKEVYYARTNARQRGRKRVRNGQGGEPLHTDEDS